MLGEVIHGYRVESALSADKGGFGDVYFAVHVDSGAEAVVKVLKPEMSAQRDIVARFFNEARAAASVHHPGVVQIHNVGYHGDRAYLLMERLRGDDLEERLTRGPLPVDRALVFVRQAAGAIGAAHDRGIVHRDLKPANLFVVADPDVVGGERVKVLDFGIAKLTADAGAGKTQGVFGTPAYMSPEQCASTGAVDARSDLYSLGCILYELVCGRPPFGQGGIELIAAQLRDTPPPPRAIAPWLPPAVEQVILRLLEKQPERRYASCAALIAALDEAAVAAGLLGAGGPHSAAVSAPWLAETTVPGSVPPGASAQLAAVAQRQPYPTTLGSAAGSSTVQPGGRGRGLWLGIAAVVVVVGAVVAVLAMPGRHGPEVASGSAGSAGSSGSAGDAGSAGSAGSSGSAGGAGSAARSGSAALAAVDAGTAPADATQIAHAPADATAAQVVDVTPDPTDGEDDKADGPPSKPPAGSAVARPRVKAGNAARARQLVEAGNAAMLASPPRYEEALGLYQKAVAYDPQPRAFLNLGIAAFQLGRFGQADTAVRTALAASPPEPLAGKIRKMLDRIHQEAKAQGIALGADEPARGSAAPESGSGATGDQVAKLTAEGEAALQAGRLDEALRVLQRAYDLTPGPRLLMDIGLVHASSSRCRDARREFQRLIAVWPDDPIASKAKQELERLGTCQ